MANFDTIQVSCQSHQYPIYIGQNLISKERILPYTSNKKLFIITDQNVSPFWLSSLTDCLTQQDFEVCIMPSGEETKSFFSLELILKRMIECQLNRDSLVLTLGGGVIGDLGGFAASCYQRGIDFLQLPTTLLAQVDASIGGKTGINLLGEKNVVGSFHSPRAVFVDLNFLQTLPKREYIAGLAEVIKHALIADETFFQWLLDNIKDILALEPIKLGMLIKKCCLIKAEIVSNDEKEHGIRALLNLGHTFGHALETITAHQRWLHGEAVSIGLYCQAILSQKLGYLSFEEVSKIKTILLHTGLPIHIPNDIDLDALIKLMLRDKKVLKSNMRFVVLKKIGMAQVVVMNDLPSIRSVLDIALEENKDDSRSKNNG